MYLKEVLFFDIPAWRCYDNALSQIECAKFTGLRAILGLAGLVPSCHHAFVGISSNQSFSGEYYVGPKFFLVGISWFQNFLSWLFHGSKVFFSWLFCGSNSFFWANFVIQRFSVFGCMRKSDIKYKVRSRYLFILERYFMY